LTTILTLLASVVPGLLICYFIFKQDKHEKEPLPLLAICFGLGVAIFYAARIGEGFMDDLITPFVEENELDPNTHFGVLFYSAFIRTAMVEELLKLAILLAIPFNHKQFNEPMDGIVYAVMIGMGFAIIENIVYCMPADLTLAIVRDFTAVPSHAIFGVILGYYVGLAKFNRANLIKYISVGWFMAVFIHGLYDFFLFQRYGDWLMILATFVLLGGLFFSRKFIHRHQEDSPFRVQRSTDPLPEKKVSLDSKVVLEKENKPNELGYEDNEILSAVLFEMKKKQDSEESKKEE
jgi:RsiW-degrading membrane proteinase PrsW (M82 family)